MKQFFKTYHSKHSITQIQNSMFYNWWCYNLNKCHIYMVKLCMHENDVQALKILKAFTFHYQIKNETISMWWLITLLASIHKEFRDYVHLISFWLIISHIIMHLISKWKLLHLLYHLISMQQIWGWCGVQKYFTFQYECQKGTKSWRKSVMRYFLKEPGPVLFL